MSTTKSLHRQLQDIAARELERLPELLEQLTPPERVRFIMQLLPYTAPKVNTVGPTFAEGLNDGWDD